MTHYIVYKITNIVNGKTYIGSHKTDDLSDGYMGSGKYLKRAIYKHGLENFDKHILHDFDNPEAMFAKEAELVNEDYLAEGNTYNLRVGGFGGWDYINRNESLRIRKNQKARKSADRTLMRKYGVSNPGQLPHVRKLASEVDQTERQAHRCIISNEELEKLLKQYSSARSPVRAVCRHLGRPLSGGFARRIRKFMAM